MRSSEWCWLMLGGMAAAVSGCGVEVVIDQPAPETETATDPAPAPLAHGAAITIANVSSRGFWVGWGPATDGSTVASKLEYRAVRGPTVADLDTVDEVLDADADDILLDWHAGDTHVDVSGLTPLTKLAVAVLARNPAGDVVLYPPRTVTTTAPLAR
jgi:hypothetical protein